jgi:hypothetical protein
VVNIRDTCHIRKGCVGMWTVTAIDYEAPLFTNAEAREGAGVAPMLWAKWIQRGMATPSRTVRGGRGGQYAPKEVFRFRAMNVLVQKAAIPVSEAREIAAMAADGPWNLRELAAAPTNWRNVVIRANPAPLDVFLIFFKTDNCWSYEPSFGPPTIDNFKSSAALVLAAARELNAVSQYCWNILEESERVVRSE